MNTSGIIPNTATAEPFKIAGSILESSLMAVGPYSMKNPMRQIRMNRINGIMRKMIEGTLRQCFWSSLGPHA